MPPCQSNALRCIHATDIVRAGFNATKDDALAAIVPRNRIFGVKDNPSGGGSRPGG
jgi:hypothetical protein